MKKLLLLASTAVLALAGSANAKIYYKEAEAATDLGNFTANLLASAYGGSYITASADSAGTASPALLPGAVFHMGAVPADNYDLWVRMRVNSGGYSDDSFWIPNGFRDSYDTATGWIFVNGLAGVGTATLEGSNMSGNFGWIKLVGAGADSNGTTTPYTLAADTSDLIFSIAPRENGLDIDALALVTAGQTVTAADLNPVKPAFVITGSGPRAAVVGNVEIKVTAREYSSTVSSATVSVNGSVHNATIDRSVATNVVISYSAPFVRGTNSVEVIVTSASNETATNKWNLAVWEDSAGSASVVHHWDFNDATGTNVADKFGMNGAVIGTNYAWRSGAIYLSGGGSSTDWNNGTGTATVGSYIDLPNGLLDTFTGATTFEVVYKDLGSGNWARLLDFGESSTNENMSSSTAPNSYVFLTPGNGSDYIQATVKRSPAGEFTSINDGVTKSTANLTYVVYMYDPASDQASLFVNGKIIAAHVTMTNDIALSDINDVNNWIGRSQYADPMFKGEIDDFKMSTGLLSSSQIAAEWERLNGITPVIDPPVIDRVSVSNNLFIIEYSADNVGTYTIERKTSLTGAWTVLTNGIGSGNQKVPVQMTSGAAQEFYRVTGKE